ncbi:hypothetical protein LU276_01410 [Moraxella haemolytica]|uniref:5-carboxymethyl-2-hydroxymuconate Delta-isomerase n=1 Tax=Moraxella TaxID=475 RepID=UPI002542CB76|nr:hypothetical protein [Moraxella sp. ZY171148]WII95532.1 hypothetical protein LU276_01410 [Moraxella sp. ZY171148]
MPHLTIEISQDLKIDEAQLLMHLNQALFATGEFKAAKDIKSRIHRTDASLIGLGDDGLLFVSARLAIMAGRSENTKHELVALVLKNLQEVVGKYNTQVQYTVDLQELSSYYQKVIA